MSITLFLLTLIHGGFSLSSLVIVDCLVFICRNPTYLNQVFSLRQDLHLFQLGDVMCYQARTTLDHAWFWFWFMVCSFLEEGKEKSPCISHIIPVSSVNALLSMLYILYIRFIHVIYNIYISTPHIYTYISPLTYSCFPRVSKIFHHFVKRKSLNTLFFIGVGGQNYFPLNS